MGTNRVGGAGDPRREKVHVDDIKDPRLKKVEKVKEVDEAENEGRRKKFRKFMETEDIQTEAPREPSPFEADFHKAKTDLENVFSEIPHPIDQIDNVGKSRVDDSATPPQTHVSPPLNENEQPEYERTPSTPQSGRFSEAPGSSKELPSKKKTSTKDEKNVKGELIFQNEEDPNLLKNQKASKDKETGISIQGEEKKGESLFLQNFPTEEKKNWTKGTKKGTGNAHENSLSSLGEQTPTFKKKETAEDRSPGQGNHHQQEVEMDPSSLGTLPPSVISIAQVATAQATPYVHPEISPLFFQMVGAIHVILGTPGMTKTEIELTSPSFSRSKFFGAKIVVEKYATAPDSLNIRLTGTNEAVKSFNQNIASLRAAFENGTFDFRIGRISAEYSTDRPVFKRRDGEGKSGGDSGFSGEKNK